MATFADVIISLAPAEVLAARVLMLAVGTLGKDKAQQILDAEFDAADAAADALEFAKFGTTKPAATTAPQTPAARDAKDKGK